MYVRIEEDSTAYQTSIDEVARHMMPSMKWEFRGNPTVAYHEYRDITVIKRSVPTSNCAFIGSKQYMPVGSTKAKVLSTRVSQKITIEVQRAVESIEQSQQQSGSKAAMRKVYDSFLTYQSQQEFGKCNELLSTIKVEETSELVLVSLLMASFSMRRILAERESFYQRVFRKVALLKNPEEAEKMLGSLR